MRKKKRNWIKRKYMGDCQGSWAIIDKNFLPKGHRGVIMLYLPQEAVSYSGLNRSNADYYLNLMRERENEK